MNTHVKSRTRNNSTDDVVKGKDLVQINTNNGLNDFGSQVSQLTQGQSLFIFG